VFLKRPTKGEPRTRGELEEARERLRSRRRAVEREELATLLELTLEPYTLARLDNRVLPSLREAAVRIERRHGVIQDEDGRLVFLFHGKAQGVADAVRVLRAEERIVLNALAQKTDEQTLSELLPDEQALHLHRLGHRPAGRHPALDPRGERKVNRSRQEFQIPLKL
jgi:hypothetical protein